MVLINQKKENKYLVDVGKHENKIRTIKMKEVFQRELFVHMQVKELLVIFTCNIHMHRYDVLVIHENSSNIHVFHVFQKIKKIPCQMVFRNHSLEFMVLAN